jgi:hypothetical protein
VLKNQYLHYINDDHVDGTNGTGLLSNPFVIYEHGEPWWNDIGRRKIMIRPPELSGNTDSRALVSKQRNWENEIMN